MHIKFPFLATTTEVQILFQWHDIPSPESPPLFECGSLTQHDGLEVKSFALIAHFALHEET